MTHRIPAQAEPPKKAMRKKKIHEPAAIGHEGATESQTGDRTGPGAGYDQEPAQVKDKGGVA